jgi:hypothetical protein
MIGSYFLIPAVLESSFTSASQIARQTHFADHFLCINQLWNAPYFGYGGSVNGCFNDGMSFALGKFGIIGGAVGIGLFLIYIFKQKVKDNALTLYILILTLISLFMTLYASFIIWSAIPFLQLFQFPWRFLIFVLFGLAFFSAYAANRIHFIGMNSVFIILAIMSIGIYSKYFFRNNITVSQFNKTYLSKEYIEKQAAYEIPEYLPRGISQSVWRSTEIQDDIFLTALDNSRIDSIHDDGFVKIAKTDSQVIRMNIFYTPFWKIAVDGKTVEPEKVDNLLRPIVSLEKGTHTVTLIFKQTPIEILSDWLSLLAIVSLLFAVLNTQFRARVKLLLK